MFEVRIAAEVVDKAHERYGEERSSSGRPSEYDFVGGPLAAAVLEFRYFDELSRWRCSGSPVTRSSPWSTDVDEQRPNTEPTLRPATRSTVQTSESTGGGSSKHRHVDHGPGGELESLTGLRWAGCPHHAACHPSELALRPYE
jgi:hypothetical protein